MASTRDAGWEAFQQGNSEEAIRLLKQACVEDPSDYESHLYLGAVYGSASMHEEAIATLTTAVHLNPANAQARYNLGVAMEKAGHFPQALEAFHQAVTLDPGYEKAAEAINRLQPGDQSNHQGAVHERTAEFRPPPSADNYEPTMQSETANAGIASSSDAAIEPDAPGFASAARAGATSALPSHGLLSQYTPSPNAPAGPTAILEPYSSEMPPPNYNDEMDIPGAVRDFGRILISPDPFFREQAGRTGLMSPMLMVGVFLILQFITILVSNSSRGLFSFVAGLVVSPFSLAMAGAAMLVTYLISALIVHFLGWIFGNRQDYSMSVKACVYSDAPRFVLSLLVSIYFSFVVMPGIINDPKFNSELEEAMSLPAGTINNSYSTTGTYSTFPATRPTVRTTTTGKRSGSPTVTSANPAPPQASPTMFFKVLGVMWRRFGVMILMSFGVWLVGWLWSSVLLAMAIHRFQRIPAISAAAVVVIMYAFALLLVAVLAALVGGAVVTLIKFALQNGAAAGTPGPVH